MILFVAMSKVLVIRALEFRICFEFRDSNFGFNTFNSKLSSSRGKPKLGSPARMFTVSREKCSLGAI